MEQGYKKLIVYQKSRLLILNTYKITSRYPKGEIYTLIPQMRRSAISISANIVEGYSKKTRKDFARFIDISIGSINELEFFFELSRDLKYLNQDKLLDILGQIIEIKKLLYSFQKSLKRAV